MANSFTVGVSIPHSHTTTLPHPWYLKPKPSMTAEINTQETEAGAKSSEPSTAA